MLVVDAQVRIPVSELRLSFSRSGGPGGQNVNKVNSKVTLHWDVERSPSLPPDVRERFVARYRRRHQHGGGNRHPQPALPRPGAESGRLPGETATADSGGAASSGPAPAPRRPSRASRERRLQAKQHTAEKKRLRHRTRRRATEAGWFPHLGAPSSAVRRPQKFLPAGPSPKTRRIAGVSSRSGPHVPRRRLTSQVLTGRMTNAMFGNPAWFRKKTVGWGLRPVSWKGWLYAAVVGRRSSACRSSDCWPAICGSNPWCGRSS